MKAIEDRFDSRGYGPFKEAVAEAVVEVMQPIQKRYQELRPDPELARLLAKGAARAGEVAGPTLAAMYDRMGFVRRG